MLIDQIRDDFQTALKQADEVVKSVLRLTLAALKNKEIDKGEPLTDEEAVAVLQNQAKKRKESITAFEQGNRPDLVAKERQELAVLDKYLPQEMSPSELAEVVRLAVESTKASGLADFGKVMGVVMGQVKGQADGTAVSAMVKKALS
jgi:hypothetical protein